MTDAVSFLRRNPERGGVRHDMWLLCAGFFAALVIRSLFLLWLRPHNNLVSWRVVVDVLEAGKDLYRDTGYRYNYSPLWAGVLWALSLGERSLGISLDRVVTFFLLATDVATAWLLWRVARRRTVSRWRAVAPALLFFANPVSVIVSGSLGAFDNLAVFFLLLAVDFADRGPARKAAAVGAVTLSLLAKHIAWFHPFLFFRRRAEPRIGPVGVIVPYAFFFGSLLPFWRSRSSVLSSVFGYRALDEPYGLEPIRFWTFLPTWVPLAIFLGAVLVAVYWLQGVEFGRGSLLLFLVVLIFTPGIGQNYFVWPIALGALYPSAGYFVYTLMVSLFLMHSPEALGVALPHLPGWSGPWWAAIFWLLWEMRAMERKRS